MVSGLLRKCPQSLSFLQLCPWMFVDQHSIKDTLPGTAINIMGGTWKIQRLQGALIIWVENTSWHFSEK